MKTSKKISLGGIISALSLVFMLVSSLFPFAEYISPAFAGAILIIIVIELGKTAAFTAYIAISILSMLIVSNKEVVFLFICFLGFYPILKSIVEKLNFIIKWLVKILTFNVAIFFAYWLMLNVLGLKQVISDMGDLNRIEFYMLAILGNITFIFYDKALTKIIALYFNKIKPRFNI